jgi:hypothetical protein
MVYFYGASIETVEHELFYDVETPFVVEGIKCYDVVNGDPPRTIKRFIETEDGRVVQVHPATILRSPVRLDACSGSEDGWHLGGEWSEREENRDAVERGEGIRTRVIGWSDEKIAKMTEMFGPIYDKVR